MPTATVNRSPGPLSVSGQTLLPALHPAPNHCNDNLITHSATHSLVYKPQYLEVTTSVNPAAALYGLGGSEVGLELLGCAGQVVTLVG